MRIVQHTCQLYTFVVSEEVYTNSHVWFVVASRTSLVMFFFSSRRRHTRFDCDWSSDVCSSDLLSGSRGGMLAFGVQVIALAVLLRPQRGTWKEPLALGVFLAVMIGFLLWIGGKDRKSVV